MKTIAYFVTPHGFGHAARACAVMAAWQKIDPAIRFEIYTQVPVWFFQDSLAGPFHYHSLMTDIGLVQTSALQEDLHQTLERLNDFLPFDPALVSELAGQIRQSGCDGVLCDIAPLGVAVAKEAGLPSVLIENFTWEWIYEGYLAVNAELGRPIEHLKGITDAVDYRIQTQPVCPIAPADLTVRPVARQTKRSSEAIRRRLQVPLEAKLVLLTMGGIPPQRYPFLERLVHHKSIYFAIPGASQTLQRQANLLLLPHHSEFYHPDLVHSSDMVIGKLGYSTLAEAYWAGIPYGCVKRANFRESDVLIGFVEEEMTGFAMDESHFQSGDWLTDLPLYLDLPRIARQGPNGAEQIARFIRAL